MRRVPEITDTLGIVEVFFTAPDKEANRETGAEDGHKVKLHDVL